MKRKRIKLRYKKERVLFSDVLPYELPLTFTNRFFYRFLVKNGVSCDLKGKVEWRDGLSAGTQQVISLLFGIDMKTVTTATIGESPLKSTIPFFYQVKHKEGKYRELAVIHPADQVKMVSFYEKYNGLILHYCQQSRFSLRHPSAVACYFYYRDRLHHTLLGKHADNLEIYFNEYENLKSYFSYKNYPHIYKFYEDYRYQRAEKKFSRLQRFDIQACFNSIYTHSIAWATLSGKEVYKQHFVHGFDGTFASAWDSLMRKMNYDETNGIVIGPEFSRLFAEVILQYIDKCVERDLLQRGYRWNVDYLCYRYVDDHFFFYNQPDVLEVARSSYAKHLNEYKMVIGTEKTEDFERPFITPISRAKLAIDRLLSENLHLKVQDALEEAEEEKALDDLLDQNNVEEAEETCKMDELKAKTAIEQKFSLFFRSMYFSSSFQDIVKQCEVKPKDVLNYTIAGIANRTARLLKAFDRHYKPLCFIIANKDISTEIKEEATRIRAQKEHQLSLFLFNLLDSAFFIYSLNRRVNTTLKLMQLLNNIIVYIDSDYTVYDKKENTVKRFTDEIRANVFKKIQDEIHTILRCSRFNEDTQLETLYLLITLRSLNTKYHLGAEIIKNYMCVTKNSEGAEQLPEMNALSITLFLYYFGNRTQFEELKVLVVKKACEHIKKRPKEQRNRDAERLILLLDLMACPFLSKKQKDDVGKAWELTPKAIRNLEQYFRNGQCMFTNWKKLNITKELNAKISQEVYA